MGNTPADAARKATEREAFLSSIRAANRPAAEAPSCSGRPDEPPFPSPTLEAVLAMPTDDARVEAARLWLSQFCRRARYVLGVTDLRHAERNVDAVHVPIARVRHVLSPDEVETALKGE